ncbi:hypothetical protein JXQ31_10410 [candidate division KSB1 bacterium]|nr:hypothetical protein [candidate division KSB1 bacterium]
MKYLNNNTLSAILKILVLSSLMILVFGFIHCSDMITEPKEPDRQPEYNGISGNNPLPLIAA